MEEGSQLSTPCIDPSWGHPWTCFFLLSRALTIALKLLCCLGLFSALSLPPADLPHSAAGLPACGWDVCAFPSSSTEPQRRFLCVHPFCQCLYVNIGWNRNHKMLYWKKKKKSILTIIGRREAAMGMQESRSRNRVFFLCLEKEELRSMNTTPRIFREEDDKTWWYFV